MNRFAYRTTGLAISTLSRLLKARISLHGKDNIPDGSLIFAINHFTRAETFIMPYYIFKLINKPVWSLAAANLFIGTFGSYLEKVGAVSTQSPDRDRLIVKTLLTGEAAWIIFPEGRMVKSKKIIEKGKYMVSYAGGKRAPHTGAATLALRTEFYRRRLLTLSKQNHEEAKRLAGLFRIDSPDQVSLKGTYIIPVNLTYYPVRAKENLLLKLAHKIKEDLPERIVEELMTEGSMLLSGVDISINIGEAIPAGPCLQCQLIDQDVSSSKQFNFDDPIPSVSKMRKESLKIMQQYMSSIYGLTTVNYDHFFASFLKHYPLKKIEETNLKRRVYLATTRKLDQLNIRLHPKLTDNQIHLLTDDQHSIYKDFIELAEEKGVVKRAGNTLSKDQTKLSSIFDFHRVRIDNPIAVIANEVEPLTKLQRRITRLCWQPKFWIKRKIVRYLHNKALQEFEKDYEQYYLEKESKPKDIGRPFFIKGRSKRTGILLMHGYMAAPEEVRKLATYIAKRGYWVYVPRLKGHGTSSLDLAERTFQDWLTSVEEGYGIIRNVCRNVVVGGFSTGAGLALHLASRIKEVKGVFAVSTPLRLQYIASRFVPAVDVWNKLMDKVRFEEAKKEFVNNNPENPHINYFNNPISGVRELERLMADLEPRLPRIMIPSLVIQSENDPVVDPKGSEQLFQSLGSENKQYIKFNYNRHGILLGDGAEKVYRVIGDFIQQIK